MFNKIRSQQKKILLVILASIIIPSFILWSGVAYLKEKKSKIFLYIGNRKLTYSDFNYYTLMVKALHLAGFDPIPIENENDKKMISETLINKGLEYLLLLWKAEKDKIRIPDNEVIQNILEKFSLNNKFNKEQYLRFLKYGLKIEPKLFEEYVRNYIKIKKILEKYIKVEISDEEIKNAYIQDTQKAKICYIYIPYEKFKNQITITEKELEDFYKKNELLFKEETKVKIRYVIIDYNNPEKDKILNESSDIKNLNNFSEKFNLEIKETDFIGLKDPIPQIGWEEKINKTIFLLQKGKISQPIETDKGYIIVEKKEEKAASIPPLETIKDKVEEKIKEVKIKKASEEFTKTLLEEISQNNINDLEEFAKKKNLEFKTTNYFKYYDYIEGVGLDEKISNIVFSLKKDEIFLSPLLLEKGSYIIQLKDISTPDEKDFESAKEKYINLLKTNKNFTEKIKLISAIAEESKIKIINLQ